MFSTKHNIGKRVMKVVKDRIAQAQKQFDDEVKVLEAKFEEDKDLLADKMVNNVVGNLLPKEA